MDLNLSGLFTRLIELSPFVAALFYFLHTVWNNLQKKDAALLDTMKEHSAQSLALQKETILAMNNSADATRQVAGALEQLRTNQNETSQEIKGDLVDIKDRLPRNGARRPSATSVTPAAQA